jgi:hypothetical protein
MPSILDLFKQANANGEVTMWNGDAQNKGLGGKIMDFVKAEINPKGPRVLFYKKLVTPPLIYGTETPRISLKGTVDPARSLAVASAKYIGDKDATKKPPLLNLGSLLGGSANRPSDTIFDKTTGLSVAKGTLPASVGDHSAIRYAVDAGVDYDISKVPMGPNALSGVLKGDLNQMAGKAIGAGIGAAKKAIGKAVTNLVTKKRKKGQKGPKGPTDRVDKSGKLYAGGTKKSTTGNVADGNVKNSDYLTSYTGKIPTGVIERKGDYIKVDDINAQILRTPYFKDDSTLRDTLNTKKVATPYIKIKPYGKDYSMVFPATITGLTESVTPEWNSFKYVGSPYNTHRYNGVERTLSFEFKLYYLDEETKYSMISSLNSLKELAFPYNEVSYLKYDDKDVALSFSPNLIELSINGYYKNLFGFITQLEFSVDDATSWATTRPNMESVVESLNGLYPTVISVSFGMTIIENHRITEGSQKDTKIIRYNFDGRDNYTLSMKMEGLEEKDREKINAFIKQFIIAPPKITAADIEEPVVEENPDAIIPK